MAHSLSAKKRARQNAKRRVINRGRKSMVKTQIKHVEAALSAGEAEQAAEQFRVLAKSPALQTVPERIRSELDLRDC